MAAPTSPYIVSSDVSILMQPHLVSKGGLKTDFDTTTNPTKSQVDTIITRVCGQIDLRFQMAGYVLPLAEISGESWLSHQTAYLQLIASYGVVGTILGPTKVPGAGAARSSYPTSTYDMYQQELNLIFDPVRQRSSIWLRAQFYQGSPVEKNIGELGEIGTEYSYNKINPNTRIGSMETARRLVEMEIFNEESSTLDFWKLANVLDSEDYLVIS